MLCRNTFLKKPGFLDIANKTEKRIIIVFIDTAFLNIVNDLGNVTFAKQLRTDLLINKTRDAIKKFFAIIEDFRYTNHGASPFFCCDWFGHLYYSKYKGLVPFYRA